jgi:hypothetical protein
MSQDTVSASATPPATISAAAIVAINKIACLLISISPPFFSGAGEERRNSRPCHATQVAYRRGGVKHIPQMSDFSLVHLS